MLTKRNQSSRLNGGWHEYRPQEEIAFQPQCENISKDYNTHISDKRSYKLIMAMTGPGSDKNIHGYCYYEFT